MAALLLGCDDDAAADTAKVLEAVIVSTDEVYQQIEDDPSWSSEVPSGIEIGGMLERGGGTLTVSGWRTITEHENEQTYFQSYGEKLTYTYVTWTVLDIQLSGQVVLTRHNLDVGPAGSDTLDDADRTTVYKGTLASSGPVEGSFTLDVHSTASGTLTWSCGQINEEPQGSGLCF